MPRTWRIAGISFDHVHMPDLLRMAATTPNAELVGIFDEQRGRAVTFIFLGWSLASVLGMPMAAYVGGTLGWRSAFGLVALLVGVSSLAPLPGTVLGVLSAAVVVGSVFAHRSAGSVDRSESLSIEPDDTEPDDTQP